MATIIPFLQDGAFEPDDIHSMSTALDEVCKALLLPDGDHPARRVVAERIIALARRGERSPTRLRDRVIQEAGLAEAAGLTDGADQKKDGESQRGTPPLVPKPTSKTA